MTDALLRELLAATREQTAVLRALRSDLAGRHAPDTATADLLRAIGVTVGDRVFTAGDLARHAALPGSQALHDAILRVCRGVRG